MLGEARSTLQRWDQAFAALQQAETLDPKNETALHALGAYYGRRGDFAQSLGYLERALEVNPASSNAWSSKGYSLLKLQRYDQAAEALQTAVRLQPDNANAWINLGETYLRQGQLAKAIAVLERACKLAPQAVDSRLYAAQAYLASGQAAKAKEHLDALLLQQRDQPMAWYMLTGIYISQGKQAETLDAYAQLNRLQPALARDLKEKLRGKQLPGGITLPD
jgi:tetratricopeptide (TPR) repeat protein